LEEGTHERHSIREEDTDRRYSSWKKKHIRVITKELRNILGIQKKRGRRYMIYSSRE
jgi:hypothetical protein